MKASSILITLTMCCVLAPPTHLLAQWQSDVRLTNASGSSQVSFNNARCIAASGNTIHVVWQDIRDGNTEIYYKRSLDDGSNWGVSDTRLTNNSSDSRNPAVATSGDAVHVVWHDGRDGNLELYYKRSLDGGTSWGADTRLTNNTYNSFNSSVAVSDTIVHVAWIDGRSGNNEIYYKRSSNGGTSWGADTRLSNTSGDSFNPCVAVSGSTVHVIWHDNSDGNLEIYYKRSLDGGLTWSGDIRLTNDPAVSSNPSLAVSGSTLHVVWYDQRDGNKVKLYYKRSNDGGGVWGPDVQLTSDTSGAYFPSVTASNSVVNVFWHDIRDGNFEIYGKRSADGGGSWGADTRLTSNSSISMSPSAAMSGSVVHVVWNDNRDGNYEIYYKKDPTGNLSAVGNHGATSPREWSLEQNFPNPFNPSTTIRYQLQTRTHVTLKLYDILGREITTLVDERQDAGYKTMQWSGAGLPSGVYVYRLTAGNFVATKKLILIR